MVTANHIFGAISKNFRTIIMKDPVSIDCSRSSSGAGAGSPDLWSEPAVFGGRARFIDYGGSQPAVLSISDVSKFHDEGKLAISMTSMKYGSEALSLSFK